MHHHLEADIYVRLSLDRDGKTALERQEADCRAWAERNGLHVRTVHTDQGRSGFKNVERKGFDSAIAALKAGVVGTLIVWKLDRLSRKGIGEVGTLLDDLSRVGGRIVSVMDSKDTSVESDRVIIALLAELARSESKNIGTRVSSAKRYLRKSGQWIGGQPPYGLRVDSETKRLRPDPETWMYARLIADMALADTPLVRIARFLNAEEIEAPRGGQWTAGSLAQLLRAPAFAGLMPETKFTEAKDGTRKYGNKVEPYRHPETGEQVSIGEGIISLGERDAVKRLMEDRMRVTAKGTRRPAPVGTGLLTGLLRCGLCERRMSILGASYRCSSRTLGGSCEGANALAASVDKYVADSFLSRLPALEPDDPLVLAIADRWVRRVDPELFARRDAIQAELDDQTAALADLEAARYVRGEFKGADAVERYGRLSAALQHRIAGLSADLAALPSPDIDVSPLLDAEQLIPAWKAAQVDERRALLRLAIDRVSVSKGQRGKRFDGQARVTIEWAQRTEA